MDVVIPSALQEALQMLGNRQEVAQTLFWRGGVQESGHLDPVQSSAYSFSYR